MATIVLATANAKFSHASFALRYLKANLGKLEESARLMEFTIEERASDIAEKILNEKPEIVGLSVYLWNVELLTQVVTVLKDVHPDLIIVVGGPEVSFKEDFPAVVELADYCVTGDGEVAFSSLCSRLLEGKRPKEKVIEGGVVDLEDIQMPYEKYTDEDIAHRVLYVEASRGCPFGCEFCLASNDKKVRKFPANRFLNELEVLFKRGARRFKFVDRTLHVGITNELLEFFIERQDQGIFVHFEIVPDRISSELLALLKRFKRGSLQLEVGVQSFNSDVTSAINRKQNPDKAESNLRLLCKETDAHIHSDLVVGLPGETLSSFADGFDRLLAIDPDEIQVGILKRLRGAAIKRHDEQWIMTYSSNPPYEILQNKLIDFSTMQRLKRFSRYFDMVSNNGNFNSTARLVLSQPSPFKSFLNFSDWLHNKTGRTNAIALNRLATLIFEYLTLESNIPKETAANTLYRDFAALGRRSFPGEVMGHVTQRMKLAPKNREGEAPPRQARHTTSNSR